MSDLKKVLDYVNIARKALNLSTLDYLSKGEIENATRCPIANALGDTMVRVVDDLYIYFFNTEDANKVNLAWYGDDLIEGFSGKEVHTPRCIQEFIEDFDNAKYPELIEETDETK